MSLSTAEERDPIIEKLIEMLEANGPTALVNKYIQGDVLAPPKSELPIVSIAKDGTNVRSDGTMQDVHTISIVLAVIEDWTKDLNESFDLTRGTNALWRYFEKRNANYSVAEKTLIYALRANQKLDNNLFISINDNGLEADYGLGIEKRGSNIFSVEGIIRFNIELTQQKPNLY